MNDFSVPMNTNNIDDMNIVNAWNDLYPSLLNSYHPEGLDSLWNEDDTSETCAESYSSPACPTDMELDSYSKMSDTLSLDLPKDHLTESSRDEKSLVVDPTFVNVSQTPANKISSVDSPAHEYYFRVPISISRTSRKCSLKNSSLKLAVDPIVSKRRGRPPKNFNQAICHRSMEENMRQVMNDHLKSSLINPKKTRRSKTKKEVDLSVPQDPLALTTTTALLPSHPIPLKLKIKTSPIESPVVATVLPGKHRLPSTFSSAEVSTASLVEWKQWVDWPNIQSLSPEERSIASKQNHRLQNRDAAIKSRLKKQVYMEVMETELIELRAKYASLQTRYTKLLEKHIQK